jgi:hypothetical protein
MGSGLQISDAAAGLRKEAFRTVGLLWLGVVLLARAPLAHAADSPVFEFLQPTNNAVFSTRDEIPIVLHAYASNDVFPTADVFAHSQKIATVSYCCTLCPCVAPFPGLETTLQIPAPWQGGKPPPNPWQGWTNVMAGMYQLTARATGENATVVSAGPVTITVIDRTVEIFVNRDGSVTLVIPRGSLVPGGYDAEASADLRSWIPLGAFQPGDVAAFYFDVPPEAARGKRFYRSVYTPP